MPQNEIKKILEEAKRHFTFSGAQIYAQRGSQTIDLSIGETSYWPGGNPVDSTTLFDIGSLTKVLATNSILARLHDRGEFDLDVPLRSSFSNTTPRHILTHTAGFLDWYPIFKDSPNGTLLDWFEKSKDKILVSKPGEKVLYSDLGIILLWELLKAKWGSIEEIFKKEVIDPLKLTGISFGPISDSNVAATEYDVDRKDVWKGTVFDENARWLGGKAPHAGLFSSARSIAPWCEEWLKALQGNSKWLGKKTAQLFTKCHTKETEAPRGIGFDLKSKTKSSAGTKMHLSTFGHLGYTGCSVWMDPEIQMSVIFLTNRVHPLRADERIRGLRPLVHDAVFSALEAK